MKKKGFMYKIRKKIYEINTKNSFMPSQYSDAELGNLIFGHSRGNYSIDRQEFEDVFSKFLERNSFDYYGHRLDMQGRMVAPINMTDFASYDNGTFLIRPYYWGDDAKVMFLPNFIYYPTDLRINWYKYPLRDAYSNRLFTREEFIKILKDCEGSMDAVYSKGH